jgi:hypothetical protein
MKEVNENEKKVLKALAESYYDNDEFGFWGFDGLAKETCLDRKQVRRACRSLRRKGLAQFEKGLWTEDGEPAGAGYGATKEGAELARTEQEPLIA